MLPRHTRGRWVVAALIPVALLAIGLGAVFASESEEPEREGTSAPRIVQPGAPGEPSRELTEDELREIEAPPYNAADVRFMEGMIPHHAQALEMTALVPDRRRRGDLALFARRIEVSQEGEIELMQEWLAARGEDVPAIDSDHAHEGELMPGMLTEQQFARLSAAAGAQFDRLFLELMTQHHKGALVMVEELRAGGGGLEPESSTFAAHVEADQGIEISRMREMLAELDAG
ncbi:MAG: DUF305 domain-containing protein [Candidatus Limnocylindria bacterium]